MKTPSIIALMTCLVLTAGCVSAPLPPEMEKIALQKESSSAVALFDPELTMRKGQLVLRGALCRQFGAKTTARSHVDILFLAADGRTLCSEVTDFAPQVLQRIPRQKQRAHYSIAIRNLPPGTTAILVRAHEGFHS